MTNATSNLPLESSPAENGERPGLGPPQFSIADMLMVMTIVGGLLGRAAVSPGWAATLSCIAGAALLRTAVVIGCYGISQRRGRFWSFWLEYLVSFVIMFLVAAAAVVIPFFGVVLAFEFGHHRGGYIEEPVLWPFAASLLLAPTVMGLVLWFTRRATAILRIR